MTIYVVEKDDGDSTARGSKSASWPKVTIERENHDTWISGNLLPANLLLALTMKL